MASAGTESEEEFSEQGSDSDNYFSDFDESKISDNFLEDLSLLFEEHEESDEVNISERPNMEDIQKSSAIYSADLSELENTSNPQDPELKASQIFLKKLSRSIWKCLSEAKYASILNDFVESEFFVIDGDSLLIRCLHNQEPYLTFIYSIECFLNDFIQKGAKYVIVFFKDVEQMYFGQPNLLLLRTMFIQHLEHNTDIVLHTEFSNCLSAEWQIFLKESYPYFIIISDIGLTHLQKDYLNIFLIHSLSKKINVVLALEDSSDALRCYAYHVQSMHKHRAFWEQNAQNLLHVYETMLKHLGRFQDIEQCLYKHLKFNFKKMHEEVCQTLLLLKNLWPEGSDIRRAVCVLTCATVLKIYKNVLGKANATEILKEEQMEHCSEDDKIEALTLEEVVDLCRMECLSVAFLCHLPLSQRAQSRILRSSWTTQVLPFIKMLQRCDCIALKQLSIISDWKLDFTYLPDFRDNCLWKNLAHYYELEYSSGLELELGKEIENYYQHLWNTVTTLADMCEFGDAFPVRSTSKLFLQQSQITTKDTIDVPSIGLIAVKSDIVEEYVGTILEDLPFLSSKK